MNFLQLPRTPYVLLASVCGALLVIALYMQYAMGLAPCNLCMFQRVAVFGLGQGALIAAVCAPVGKGRYWAAGALGVFSLSGLALSARQLWLQSLPKDQVPACGPDLDWMLESYPLTEMIMEVLKGSGGCAEVQWTFLTLSIPGWTALFFSVATLFLLATMSWRRPS
ncbi:disulphide bond formation protein DsbB [gamma proteobacterium HTCC5015]|nr:disulphide bond formation protein DsbB [gamma proteobacterium HTCC5015]